MTLEQMNQKRAASRLPPWTQAQLDEHDRLARQAADEENERRRRQQRDDEDAENARVMQSTVTNGMSFDQSIGLSIDATPSAPDFSGGGGDFGGGGASGSW